jgi:hypothetical protein
LFFNFFLKIKIPVGAIVTNLNAFDLSLTNQSLCYSIIMNEYFQLKYNQEDPSPYGSIILKKALNTDLFLQQYNHFNITALLYYCNEPMVIAKQKIIFTLLNVNKNAPRLNIQVNNLRKKTYFW